jgi:hypothetical protein
LFYWQCAYTVSMVINFINLPNVSERAIDYCILRLTRLIKIKWCTRGPEQSPVYIYRGECVHVIDSARADAYEFTILLRVDYIVESRCVYTIVF